MLSLLLLPLLISIVTSSGAAITITSFRYTAEMFVTVLYGDSEEMLFNINCKVQLLLESIKHSCHYEYEGEIELADDTGQVKNLVENQQRYANEILLERETCVLLAVTTKLGNWGESKDSGRKLKSKKSNRKSTVVISTPPEVPGKQGTSVRKRSVKP
ncbi:uncharacterized protein [Engystomops pustulosus]|uniref:uncharacterized protein isoform X2 n=1 Tax=Engystomops pustulosus TaxID=76066 RepID=UPI003AFA24F0